MSQLRKNLTLSFLLIALAAVFVTSVLIHSQNRLYRNEFWTPYRSNFYGMLSGGIESLLARQPVAGNKLRTHHQRVFSKETLKPSAMTYHFRLNNDETFVEVLFNADENGYEAIRISRQSWNPLFHYKALHSGKIFKRNNLKTDVSVIIPHSARLEEKDGILLFTVSGKTYPIESSFHEGKVGFDLSSDTTIWDPEITTADGKHIDAPFTVNENYKQIFFVNLGILIACTLLLMIPYRPGKPLRMALTIFLLSITYYFYDVFYYSKQTFTFDREQKTFHDGSYDLEKFRYNFFRKWFALASGETNEQEWQTLDKINVLFNLKLRYCHDQKCEAMFSEEIAPKKKGNFRIMVWGGSMSVGSGLENLEDNYPEVLYRKLSASNNKIEILNASRMLNTFDQQHGYLLRDIENFKPDLILIDAFIWDHTFDNYRKVFPHLNAIVPKMVLMRIPFNYDRNTFLSRQGHLDLMKEGIQTKVSGKSAFLKFDPVIAEWMEDYNMGFIDPNLSLLTDEVYFGGHLFWDAIHITKYGHEHWANYIAEKIQPYILK